MDERLKLGDFEGVILKAINTNRENAYGVTIRQTADLLTGRTTAIGAVYTTLDRLEEKGYVKSWDGEPDAKRGGRRKKFYAIEGAGLRAMEQKALDVKRQAELWGDTGIEGGAA